MLAHPLGDVGYRHRLGQRVQLRLGRVSQHRLRRRKTRHRRAILRHVRRHQRDFVAGLERVRRETKINDVRRRHQLAGPVRDVALVVLHVEDQPGDALVVRLREVEPPVAIAIGMGVEAHGIHGLEDAPAASSRQALYCVC